MMDRLQPDRALIARSPRLRIVEHSLALIQLTKLRSIESDVRTFGIAAGQLATIVLLETCRDLPLETTTVTGFSGDLIEAHQLAEHIAGIVILRAGNIFEPAFRTSLPEAPLYHLGIRRNEETLEPYVYSENLPQSDNWADRVIITDPMLATGGTVSKAIELVRKHHSGPIDIACLVAAPIGVQTVLEAEGECRVVTAALDERLDATGYIVPGLGDAGDRYFGTTAE